MDIGTGIAIFGVWLPVAVAFYSPNVTAQGTHLAIVVASIVTFFLS